MVDVQGKSKDELAMLHKSAVTSAEKERIHAEHAIIESDEHLAMLFEQDEERAAEIASANAFNSQLSEAQIMQAKEGLMESVVLPEEEKPVEKKAKPRSTQLDCRYVKPRTEVEAAQTKQTLCQALYRMLGFKVSDTVIAPPAITFTDQGATVVTNGITATLTNNDDGQGSTFSYEADDPALARIQQAEYAGAIHAGLIQNVTDSAGQYNFNTLKNDAKQALSLEEMRSDPSKQEGLATLYAFVNSTDLSEEKSKVNPDSHDVNTLNGQVVTPEFMKTLRQDLTWTSQKSKVLMEVLANATRLKPPKVPAATEPVNATATVTTNVAATPSPLALNPTPSPPDLVAQKEKVLAELLAQTPRDNASEVVAVIDAVNTIEAVTTHVAAISAPLAASPVVKRSLDAHPEARQEALGIEPKTPNKPKTAPTPSPYPDGK